MSHRRVRPDWGRKGVHPCVRLESGRRDVHRCVGFRAFGSAAGCRCCGAGRLLSAAPTSTRWGRASHDGSRPVAALPAARPDTCPLAARRAARGRVVRGRGARPPAQPLHDARDPAPEDRKRYEAERRTCPHREARDPAPAWPAVRRYHPGAGGGCGVPDRPRQRVGWSARRPGARGRKPDLAGAGSGGAPPPDRSWAPPDRSCEPPDPRWSVACRRPEPADR